MSNIVKVTHHWSDEHGRCYDCGDPAGYVAPYLYWNRTNNPDTPPIVTDANKLCAICAAESAANGEQIMHLFVDDCYPPRSDEHKRVLTELGIEIDLT